MFKNLYFLSLAISKNEELCYMYLPISTCRFKCQVSEFFFSQYLQKVDVPIKNTYEYYCSIYKMIFCNLRYFCLKEVWNILRAILFRLSIDECIMFLNTLRKSYPYKGGFYVQIDPKIDANRNKRCVKNHMIQYIPVDFVLGYQHQNFDITCTFHWIILLAMVLVFFIFFFLSCLWS